MTNNTQATTDYTAILSDQITELRTKVRSGMLPMVARIPALETIVGDYALAQAIHHAGMEHPPISLRDASALDMCADLLMHEYLTWEHHDKMNIVTDPILSVHQLNYRRRKESTVADMYTGMGDETIGRKRDCNGVKQRIYDYMTPERDNAPLDSKTFDLYIALEDAGLTDRQRQAIDLVYFDGLTQELAASEMDVSQPAIAKFERYALSKIRAFYKI